MSSIINKIKSPIEAYFSSLLNEYKAPIKNYFTPSSRSFERGLPSIPLERLESSGRTFYEGTALSLEDLERAQQIIFGLGRELEVSEKALNNVKIHIILPPIRPMSVVNRDNIFYPSHRICIPEADVLTLLEKRTPIDHIKHRALFNAMNTMDKTALSNIIPNYDKESKDLINATLDELRWCFSPEEVKAVLAHEFGHIAYRNQPFSFSRFLSSAKRLAQNTLRDPVAHLAWGLLGSYLTYPLISPIKMILTSIAVAAASQFTIPANKTEENFADTFSRKIPVLQQALKRHFQRGANIFISTKHIILNPYSGIKKKVYSFLFDIALKRQQKGDVHGSLAERVTALS